jgi:hypothetical protein
MIVPDKLRLCGGGDGRRFELPLEIVRFNKSLSFLMGDVGDSMMR